MNAGILIYPNVEELDFVGPWEILGMWRLHADGPEKCIIIAQSCEPVVCAKGLKVTPDVSFADCPELDILIVPGGLGSRTEVNNPAIISFIRKQANHCHSVLSVCTGAFLLQKAGLLTGKKATTHWNSLERLREFEDVTVIEERFVSDGNIWTSAGISAGIDMVLEFIASFAGQEAAEKAQAAAEYFPSGKRYGNFANNPQAPKYLSH